MVRLDLGDAAETGSSTGRLTVTDLRDVGSATERCRRLLDAGCDPDAVDAALRDDPALADSLRRRPGLRVPGHVDGDEIALRTVLGQQVSLKAANRLGGVLVELAGDDLPDALHRDGVTRVFPTPAAVAALPGDAMPMPRSRQASLAVLATALADGRGGTGPQRVRLETRERLLALKGIGPWTADYVLMRALGDPDVFLPGDVAVRAVLADHDVSGPEALATFASRSQPLALLRRHAPVGRAPRRAGCRDTADPPPDRPPAGPVRHLERTHDDPGPQDRSPSPGPRSTARSARCASWRRDGALSAVEFLGEMPDGPGEAASVRLHAARAAAGAGQQRRSRRASEPGPTTTRCWSRPPSSWRRTSRASGPTSTCRWRRPARRSSRRCGRRCARSPTATTASYGEIAGRLGRTGHGARAVGVANGRNPIPVIVPCHRVVGASGAMTGYGGGMDRKRILLELEGALEPRLL